MADPANTGIYEIVNLVDGKRYIGSAVNIRTRWCVHRHMLKKGNHHSPYLQNAWSKHGSNSFQFRVVLICPREDLLLMEQSEIDRMRPAYNISPIAGRSVISEEGKARLSKRMLGNKNTLGFKHSAESLVRLSKSKLGNTHTKGKIRPPSAVAKTAAAHRGMKRSEETRARISTAMSGKKRKPFSDETRAKLSAANKGRVISPEHLAKLQAGRKRLVYTDEQRARKSEGMRLAYAEGRHRRDRDPEYRAKIAATLTGRTLTPEHRANVAAAMRGKKRGPYNLDPAKAAKRSADSRAAAVKANKVRWGTSPSS